MVLDHKYVMVKNEVIKAERRVLKELGFCVHVKHPHKVKNYMNDSLRTDVFLRYAPEVIACACMNLAARVLQVPFPTDPDWWVLFDATECEILDICQIILKLYERKPPHWSAIEQKVNEVRKRMVDNPACGVSLSSENTPNPHAASDAAKFSPPQTHPSPKATVGQSADSDKTQNGDVNTTVTKKKQRSIRQRQNDNSSCCSDTSSDGDNSKQLPKRYSTEVAMVLHAQTDKDKGSRGSSNRRKMQEKKEREVRRALGKRSTSPLYDRKSSSNSRRR
ncbi:unnamed protein product [Soboliphyme baturini]|uniref:CYCLIN domain-containing protein n=1 Tax=Soboliphyme baturini TaxID=241478 RepID=A0A183IXA6_9BILA|nr:unnamed protein product [Soboliphyme baturini]